MCLYLDSTDATLKIGCLVFNKYAFCPDVEAYCSIKEALEETVRQVGIVHSIPHSALSWLDDNINDEYPSL